MTFQLPTFGFGLMWKGCIVWLCWGRHTNCFSWNGSAEGCIPTVNRMWTASSCRWTERRERSLNGQLTSWTRTTRTWANAATVCRLCILIASDWSTARAWSKPNFTLRWDRVNGSNQWLLWSNDCRVNTILPCILIRALSWRPVRLGSALALPDCALELWIWKQARCTLLFRERDAVADIPKGDSTTSNGQNH